MVPEANEELHVWLDELADSETCDETMSGVSGDGGEV